LIVTFSPVAVVSVNPEEDTLVIVPAEPPAAGPDRALEPLPDPNPPAGLLPAAAGAAEADELLAAGAADELAALAVLDVLLPQAVTETIAIAAAPVAMTLLRLPENMCLTPVVENS
jgi:hypothetical protein